MSKKSRLRKLEDKRTPEPKTGKTASIAHAAHKPWQIAAVCLVLALVTFIAYQGVRNNDFVRYDDDDYVLLNKHVQQGITMHSVEWAFITFDAANWHPLTWISHMVDCGLYGVTPAGHHLSNVGLHAANSILLFLLLFYLTGFLGRSAMVAFLFALHPAHVESVAWIAERKDLLCAFFWFATVFAYAWYVRKPSWRRYALIVAGFACALMSKPMAVTLPFTLLLLDCWPLRRITFSPETRAQWLPSLSKLCIEKLPLFILSAISCVITFLAQRAGGTVINLNDYPSWVRLSNAAISYWRYIGILIWPDPLRAFYYHERIHIMVPAAIVSAIALLLVTAAFWHLRRQKPYLLIGWLWFLGTLLPVIGIVQVGVQALAERYTYLPYIGLFIAVVWLAGDAVVKFPKLKLAAQLLAVAVILACSIKTSAQVEVWKDSVTLFRHVLEIDPRGEIPNAYLGVSYMREGRNTDAQEYFTRALEYNPTWYLPLSCSAVCMMRTNDHSLLPLAGQRLQQALRDAPNDPDTLSNMALWFSFMGRPKDTEAYSRKALAAAPDSVRARLYLGNALLAQNRLEESAQEYRQVLVAEPDNFFAHNNLGIALFQLGDYERAADQFNDAVRIDPTNVAAKQKLEVAQFKMKNKMVEQPGKQ
jgi:tetratricopeptide (TPR) repeat protein